ncbi:hypothetical protein ACPPVO_22115 [Dactylosporangium sp. McL0621]|uniref:hypothetical protein n=1 Tax=Dactylosporangium sp. McL0621 TaxID=3415678 RepID=UPI003CE94E92
METLIAEVCAHRCFRDNDEMRSNGPGGRTRWPVAAIVFAVVAGAAVVALARFFWLRGLSRSADWANLLQPFLEVVGLAVPVLVWLIRRSRAPDTSDAEALGRLRQEVGVTLSQEIARRNLHLPLQLRWEPTGRPRVQADRVRAVDHAPRGALLDDDGRLSAVAVTEVFNDASVRQLVILGEPGAGKTTLALLYVVEATASAGPGDPVPVPLTVAAWDPAAPGGIEAWVIDSICREYPQVMEGDVRQLLRHHKIVPVLDGFDEMPAALRGGALAQLREAAGTGLRMILTCRGEEYARVTSEVGVLPQAVVVEVAPVEAGDAIAYLTGLEAAGSTRWNPVIAAMTGDPQGPVASALSTPLMIGLARRVYERPASDPAELATAATAGAVRNQLLAGFLPAAFGSQQEADRAGRWLAFLVGHLPTHPGDPDLRWWRLGLAVPRLVITSLIAGAATVLGAFVGVISAWLARGSGWQGAATGAVVGLAIGLTAGRNTARASRVPESAPRRAAWLSAIVSGLTDMLFAAATLSAVGAAVLVGLRLVAAASALTFSTTVNDEVASLMARDISTSTVLVVLLAVVPAVVANGLGAGRVGLPRRTRLLLRRLPRHLLIGLGTGLLMGAPWLILGLLGVSGLDEGVGYGLAATTAGFLTVTLGLGRWLSSPVSEPEGGHSPVSVLRSDRRALLTTGLAVAGVTGGTVAGLGGWPPDRETVTAGLVVAVASLSLLVLGSGSAWVSYSVARNWLAMRGKLPWRLTTFLSRAQDRGVLRQAGAAYQVRHDVVRRYLAEHWPVDRRRRPQSARAQPAGNRARFTVFVGWLLAAAAAVSMLTALPLTASAIDPRPPIKGTIKGYNAVFSPDGRLVVTTLDSEGHSLNYQDQVTELATGRAVARIDHVPFLSDLWFSPDGRSLAIADGPSGSEKIQMLDTSTGQRTAALDPPVRPAPDLGGGSGLVFSPDGRTVAIADDADSVWLYDTATGKATATLSNPPESSFGGPSLAFSPDGRTLATVLDRALLTQQATGDGQQAGTVRLWDVATGRLAAAFGNGDSPSAVRFSPDGGTIITYPQVGNVDLWSATGEHIATVDHGFPSIVSLGTTPFSADGRTMAVVDVDDRVELWDTTTRRRTAIIGPVPSDSVVQLSPDAQTLAVIPGDRSGRSDRVPGPGVPRTAVQLWNVSTDRVVATLDTVRNTSGLTFSPDSRTLATIAADDGRVRLWRTSTGQQTAFLDRVQLATSICFTADGRTVAIDDGAIRLWSVPR